MATRASARLLEVGRSGGVSAETPSGCGVSSCAACGGVLARGLLEPRQGGPQGRQHGDAVFGRQPCGDGHRSVVLVAPGQTPGEQCLLVIGPGDLAVRPREALQLVRGHRGRDFSQVRIAVRGGDPGQGPGFGVRQPAGRELAVDDRQRGQGTRDPHLLACGATGHAAFPRQPGGARRHVPVGPSAAGVEFGEQLKEPAGCRRQVARQLADLQFQLFQGLLAGGSPGRRPVAALLPGAVRSASLARSRWSR